MGRTVRAFLSLCALVTLLALTGCEIRPEKPEQAGKSYVEKNLTFDKNVKMDTTGLNYEVVSKTDDTVTLKVTGTIACDGEIVLSKDKNTWKVQQDKPKKAPAPVKTDKAAR